MNTPKTFTEEVRWKSYMDRLKAHIAEMEKIKPSREDFQNEIEFQIAIRKWIMESTKDEPVPPEFVREWG